jgi:4,5-DOPA dioxygenase extradiol
MTSSPSGTRMPAVFVGHGSPMNALEHNRYTQAWHDFGRWVPKPSAIVAISAHWYINAAAVTAMAWPKTIHDFFGFPDELFAFQYPASGAPEVAAAIAELVQPIWIGQDTDSWGIDHGTWSVLAHMFPDADVPVIQLSLDATKSWDDHVALGAALAPLRDRGVLFMMSGNVVHNLRRIRWDSPEGAFDWAQQFDQDTRTIMTERPADIGSLERHEHYPLASPTPDHFLPLLYLAGMAGAAETTAEVLVGGYAYGSLSMTSFTVA